MEIKKQWVSAGKTVLDSEVKTVCDGSIIVPDVKPDIMKVLQVDANTYLCDKTMEDGRATISGKVLVTVLYIPEDDGDKICSIRGCFDFCEVIKNPEFADGMHLMATAESDKVTYKLINSRKIGIEAQVVIAVQVTTEENLEYITSVENAQCRSEEISLESGGLYKEYGFTVEESFSASDVREILKENLQIREKEYKTLTDKVVVKAKAVLEALYLDQDGEIRSFAREMPFTEVVEMSGIFEDSECDVAFEPREISVEIDDGTLKACFDVTCTIRAESEQKITALCDCYFTDATEEIEFADISAGETVAKPSFRTVIKEIVTKKDTMPEISGVYSAVAKPQIESVKLQDGKISVCGRLAVCVLYTSENSQMPVSGICESLPFSYSIDCQGADGDCEIFIKGECEHISTVICSADSVELRAGIFLCGRVVRKKSHHIISDVKKGDVSPKEKGILVYFVKKDDSLWDVAKKYRIPKECVMDAVADGDLREGMKLLIPMG